MPLFYNDNGLVLPKTFRVPNLCHLVLVNFALLVGSSLLATATGLVTFSLSFIPPSVYWHMSDLLQRVLSMQHLQTLGISFYSAVPNNDIGRWVMSTPNETYVVLPNLHWLGFQGSSTYMEAILPHMTTPQLEKLQIYLFNKLTMSVTNLQQFISTTETLRFTGASLRFGRVRFALQAYPHKVSRTYSLSMVIYRGFDTWPLSSTAQILGVLRPVFSGVMCLSVDFCDENHMLWLGLPMYNEADHMQWCNILGSFNNVKMLCVRDGTIREISRSLKVLNGELMIDLLPKLKELICSAKVDADNLFATFVAFIEA